MRPWNSLLIFSLGFSVTFAGSIFAASDGKFTPRFNAPVLPSAPKIDGVIDKAEWIGASQSTPFLTTGVGAIADGAPRFFVGMTDVGLYIACQITRTSPDTKPSVAPGVWGSDAFEIHLGIKDNNELFSFAIDSSGRGAQGRRINKLDPRWNAPWEKAARVTPTTWEAEMFVPFTSLGVAAPEEGTLWKIIVVSNRKTPWAEISTSSFAALLKGSYPLAELFMGGTPVRALAVGQLNASEAGALVEVNGPPSAATGSIALFAASSAGLGTKVVQDTKEGLFIPQELSRTIFDVAESDGMQAALSKLSPLASTDKMAAAPGADLSQLQLAFKATTGNKVIAIDVQSPKGLLLRNVLTFQQKAPFTVSATPYLLIKGSLGITANFERLSGVAPGSTISTILKDRASGQVVVEQKTPIEKPEAGSLTLDLPLKDDQRFGRQYVLDVLLRNNAATLAQVSLPIDLPARPPWLNNTIGVTPDPLPGWTPIKIEGDKASVVMRDYQLGPSGLPAGIVSRKQPLLKGPVALSLGGADLSWTKRAQTRAEAGVAEWTSSASTSTVDVKLETKLEYDGLLLYTLTLTPKAGSADLKDLVLRIPYDAAMATRGVNSSFPEFNPMHLVGNLETGLFWFCEWAKGWQIGKKLAMEVLPAKNGVADWLIRFIGEEGRKIDKPLSFTWGLQALPVRDLSLAYEYDQRRIYRDNVDFKPEFGVSIEDMSETTLRYPISGNINEEKGTLFLSLGPWPQMRILRIGEGEDAICLGYERHKAAQYLPTVSLYRGDVPQTEIKNRELELRNYSISGPTQHLGLSWKTEGQEVIFTLVSPAADGQTLTCEGRLPLAQWKKALTYPELVIGGDGTLSLDAVATFGRELTSSDVIALGRDFNNPPEGALLLDPLDSMRFSRGLYLTRPLRIVGGKGGIAGAKYSGIMVKPFESDGIKGITIPSKEARTGNDIVQAFGVSLVFPVHEQWEAVAGYYGTGFAPNPTARARFKEYLNRGFRLMFYGDMGFEPEKNNDVGPFVKEFNRMPERKTYTSYHFDLNTPATDYYIWAWQKTMNYFDVDAIHMDNTINACFESTNLANGNGWYDDRGVLRGRYPILGARSAAQRFYWLHHVYRPGGFISLHAGARRIPTVSGFSDIHQGGEGATYMAATEETIPLPETWEDGYQFQFGVPVEILTKRGKHPFGPNMLYRSVMLFDMSLRTYADYFHPRFWWINPKNPSEAKVGTEYRPYFSEAGNSEKATPLALWWMLKDEFGAREAEFFPFFRNASLLKTSPERIRSSFFLHKGREALFVVSNFGKDPKAVLDISLKDFGFEGKSLTAYDAFTDDVYTVNGNRISLEVPAFSYRLVRVEAR